MSDEPKKGDGHRKVTLKGGPYAGYKIRVYPEAKEWDPNRKLWLDAQFPEHIDFNGDVYEMAGTDTFRYRAVDAKKAG